MDIMLGKTVFYYLIYSLKNLNLALV